MDFYWLMLLISNTSSLLLHFRSELYTLRRRAHCQITLFKNVFLSCLPEGKLSCLTTDDVCSSLGVFFFCCFFFKIFLFGFDLVLVCFLLFCCLLLDILIVSFSLYSHAQHTTKRGVRSGSSSSWTLGWQHIITLCSVRVSVWCARVFVK